MTIITSLATAVFSHPPLPFPQYYHVSITVVKHFPELSLSVMLWRSADIRFKDWSLAKEKV